MLQKLFGFDPAQNKLKTEVAAGITTFLTMGYSWQMALTAVLIEGFIFIILSATGIRSMMVDAIPASLKRAIGAGIGLFVLKYIFI